MFIFSQAAPYSRLKLTDAALGRLEALVLVREAGRRGGAAWGGGVQDDTGGGLLPPLVSDDGGMEYSGRVHRAALVAETSSTRHATPHGAGTTSFPAEKQSLASRGVGRCVRPINTVCGPY